MTVVMVFLSSDADALPIGPGVIYPDLLPGNVWGSNLRGILSRSEWDRLRIPVAQAAGMRCEVCKQPSFDTRTGGTRRPDCHELWRFEATEGARGVRRVQRLDRLIALCIDCHRVQHIGLARIKAEMAKVRAQLRKVNSWSRAEVDAAVQEADDRFRWRGQYEWDLDLSLLHGRISVEGYPSLYIPAGRRRLLGSSYLPKEK